MLWCPVVCLPLSSLVTDSGTNEPDPNSEGVLGLGPRNFPIPFSVSVSVSLCPAAISSTHLWFGCFNSLPTEHQLQKEHTFTLTRPNVLISFLVFALITSPLSTPHSLILFTFLFFSSFPFCLHPPFSISSTSHSSTHNPNTPSPSCSVSLCLINPTLPHFLPLSSTHFFHIFNTLTI